MKQSAMKATGLLALLATAATAFGQNEPQVVTVPLTRPGEPITLEIDIQSARIEVIGEDRDDVEIEFQVGTSERRIITPSGPQAIPAGSYSFEIDEDDNEISVDTDWRSDRVSVTARVPRRADVSLETINNGELIVSNITGNLELGNVNGPITATGISGSVIAEAVNDSIDVSFVRIDDVNASSFESINGDLVLRLPPNAGVELQLDTARGEIASDFEVDVLPSEPRVEREDGSSSVSVRIENVIRARINGGGPVVRMKTLHGDIRILSGN